MTLCVRVVIAIVTMTATHAVVVRTWQHSTAQPSLCRTRRGWSSLGRSAACRPPGRRVSWTNENQSAIKSPGPAPCPVSPTSTAWSPITVVAALDVTQPQRPPPHRQTNGGHDPRLSRTDQYTLRTYHPPSRPQTLTQRGPAQTSRLLWSIHQFDGKEWSW